MTYHQGKNVQIFDGRVENLSECEQKCNDDPKCKYISYSTNKRCKTYKQCDNVFSGMTFIGNKTCNEGSTIFTGKVDSSRGLFKGCEDKCRDDANCNFFAAKNKCCPQENECTTYKACHTPSNKHDMSAFAKKPLQGVY